MLNQAQKDERTLLAAENVKQKRREMDEAEIEHDQLNQLAHRAAGRARRARHAYGNAQHELEQAACLEVEAPPVGAVSVDASPLYPPSMAAGPKAS